jgi:hypothetical protein
MTNRTDKPDESRETLAARAEILENARIAVEEDPLVVWSASREAQASRIWIKALRLAGPDLEVFEALLRDEKVPRRRLDRHWRRAYGL